MSLLDKLDQTYSKISYYEKEYKTITDKFASMKTEKIKQETTRHVLNLEFSRLQAIINEEKEDISKMELTLANLTKSCIEAKTSLKRYKNAYVINKLKFDWKEMAMERLQNTLEVLDFENERLECEAIYGPSQRRC